MDININDEPCTIVLQRPEWNKKNILLPCAACGCPIASGGPKFPSSEGAVPTPSLEGPSGPKKLLGGHRPQEKATKFS